MREYRKTILNTGMIEVSEYNEPDNYKELLDNFNEQRKSGVSPFKLQHPPITGGPIIALFYNEFYADEYINFKNNLTTL